MKSFNFLRHLNRRKIASEVGKDSVLGRALVKLTNGMNVMKLPMT